MVLRCSEQATNRVVFTEDPLALGVVCAEHREWMRSHPWNWASDDGTGQMVVYIGEDTPWRIGDIALKTDGGGDSGPGSTLTLHLERDGENRDVSVWLTPADVDRLRVPFGMVKGSKD